MSPEDEHFNIIRGAEASIDSHYIYNRSRMKKNTLFKDNLMSFYRATLILSSIVQYVKWLWQKKEGL